MHHLSVVFLVVVAFTLLHIGPNRVDSFILPPSSFQFLNKRRIVIANTNHSNSNNSILTAKKSKKNRKRINPKHIQTNDHTINNNNNNNNNGSNKEYSIAANRPISSVAGVTEDHNFEQFFYSEKSTMAIYQIAKSYSFPLFLCNPSLAVLADDAKKPYLLLDRDKRFKFLSKYKEFSLLEPFLISSYSYDAVFIDPPFANITPMQLVNCLKLMAPSKDKLKVPVYIAYNSKREQDLLDAFETLPCPRLERLWRLEYRSVRDDLKICLYGPANVVD